MSSFGKKNILFVNSMNSRQNQVKETTSKLQPHVTPSTINLTDIALTGHQTSLLTLGQKVCSTRKEDTFYGNYYRNVISSTKLGILQ